VLRSGGYKNFGTYLVLRFRDLHLVAVNSLNIYGTPEQPTLINKTRL